MIHVTSTTLNLFGMTIHWYGLIIAMGIVAGVILAMVREKRHGLPKDTAVDLALIGVPAAIIGARLYFVIFSWELYRDDPLSAFFIWEGGMAIYGGIIGAVIAGSVYGKIKGLSFFRLADLAAPCIALGQAIGRWGNFVNQEAYGMAVKNPALQFFPAAVFIESDGLWHYATFFYESAWCFLIVMLLLIIERRKPALPAGCLFSGYMILYGIERALVEGLRTDSLMLGPLRVSQCLSLLVAALGAVLLYIRIKKGKHT